MMGFETPNDQRVPVSVRDWTGMKLAIWKSKFALGVVMKQAIAIIERCRHDKDCPGATIETEPCYASCPDREIRLSALVALNAARMFSPINANQPHEPYFAPSRERYSETIAELGALQIERDALLEMLRSMGVEPPAPPENTEPARLEQKPVQQFTEEDFETTEEEEEGILGQ
jgi:hypothetical protein